MLSGSRNYDCRQLRGDLAIHAAGQALRLHRLGARVIAIAKGRRGVSGEDKPRGTG